MASVLGANVDEGVEYLNIWPFHCHCVQCAAETQWGRFYRVLKRVRSKNLHLHG